MAEKTESKTDDKFEDKAEEKTHAFFAREFDYNFATLEDLLGFFDSLRELTHHLTESHYYSENVNKKVMAITFDLHACGLELKQLEAEGNEFFNDGQTAFLASKQPQIDAKAFKAFVQRSQTCRKTVFDLNTALQNLVKEIKREYSEKA